MLVRGPRGDPAKSPGLVPYLHQKVLGLLLEPARVEGTVHADGVEQLLLVLPVEGRLADQHLVEEHAEGPPVHGVVVLLAQQNLQARGAEMRLTGRGWRRGGTPPPRVGPGGPCSASVVAGRPCAVLTETTPETGSLEKLMTGRHQI